MIIARCVDRFFVKVPVGEMPGDPIAPEAGGEECRTPARADQGFSTAGMVVALLITLSLIFSAAQVYQVNSASATIQNVADVAALAALNEVAEFYLVATLCDAVVLSLSLTGTAVLGLGVVALCTPATAALSDKLIKAGNEIIKARDRFAEKVAAGLTKLQTLLPFISAAYAESVMQANSGGAMDASYVGLALVLPLEGEEITVGFSDSAEKLSKDIETDKERIKEVAEQAEEAAEEARKEKERAFLHDCGNAPRYCAYERADSLSTIVSDENPLYHSVDTWSFGVALKRAQVYYRARLANESPTDTSAEGRADSILRKRFYTYAVEELAKGYVHESDPEHFEAFFPLLPKNTDEMKQTALYTELAYPVVVEGDGTTKMHAWSGCPGMDMQAGAGYGSFAQMDEGGWMPCVHCGLTAGTFGKIAAATSSIESGFEYHYRIIAESAASYQKACEEYAPYAEELKSLTQGLFDQVQNVLDEAISYRIEVAPPGRIGVVVLAVNTQTVAASTNFASGFVDNGSTLGAQAALSAATLVNDPAEEGSTLISSMLDTVVEDSDALGIALLDGVLDLWSSVLFAYTKGHEALTEGVDRALSSIPFASESGLGTWAAGALTDLVEALGFAPVELSSPKPVLVNSAHVLSRDSSSFSQGLLEIKQSYLALEGSGSGSLFSSVVSQLEAQALEGVDSLGGEFVIASIELVGESGPSIPLTIALPPAITGVAKNLIAEIANKLRGVETSISGVRRWE